MWATSQYCILLTFSVCRKRCGSLWPAAAADAGAAAGGAAVGGIAPAPGAAGVAAAHVMWQQWSGFRLIHDCNREYLCNCVPNMINLEMAQFC